MDEASFPPKLRSRLHPLSIIGALVVGSYPGDAKVRKGFGVVVLLVGAIGALWRDKLTSTDYERRALEQERRAHAENVAIAITAMSAVAESIQEQTAEIKEERASQKVFREAFFTIMRDQIPRPRRVEVKPVPSESR